MNSPVNYDLKDGIAQITLDDGKVNAMSTRMMEAINEALDQAEKDSAIVILAGRPGIFSAGFDLKEMKANPETLYSQVKSGAELSIRLLSFPQPVITVCTGHAYPMGAFLMMSADYRFGVDGPFNIGMNEVMIGMTVPQFAIELAASRLNKPFFNRTVMTGEMFSPVTAVEAGFLDKLVALGDLHSTARNAAEALKMIDLESYRATKKKIREPLISAMQNAIATEQTLERARQSFTLKAS